MKFTKKMTDSSKLILSLILMKTMSAFFILHQFLGTVQQTLGSGGGGADAAQRCVFTKFCSTIDARKSTTSYALSISIWNYIFCLIQLMPKYFTARNLHPIVIGQIFVKMHFCCDLVIVMAYFRLRVLSCLLCLLRKNITNMFMEHLSTSYTAKLVYLFTNLLTI